MRNLGIVLGVIAALAVGVATHDTGRYQIAATADAQNNLRIFRLDTQTGAVEVSFPNAEQRQMSQIIQPK